MTNIVNSKLEIITKSGRVIEGDLTRVYCESVQEGKIAGSPLEIHKPKDVYEYFQSNAYESLTIKKDNSTEIVSKDSIESIKFKFPVD